MAVYMQLHKDAMRQEGRRLLRPVAAELKRLFGSKSTINRRALITTRLGDDHICVVHAFSFRGLFCWLISGTDSFEYFPRVAVHSRSDEMQAVAPFVAWLAHDPYVTRVSDCGVPLHPHFFLRRWNIHHEGTPVRTSDEFQVFTSLSLEKAPTRDREHVLSQPAYPLDLLSSTASAHRLADLDNRAKGKVPNDAP